MIPSDPYLIRARRSAMPDDLVTLFKANLVLYSHCSLRGGDYHVSIPHIYFVQWRDNGTNGDTPTAPVHVYAVGYGRTEQAAWRDYAKQLNGNALHLDLGGGKSRLLTERFEA